ncbi:T9SS C-terminal target domain-containing protein [Flavobacterium arcticum]|uniref:T9SS C-terminal target domain-containing protein n=1 Tax=Flavobacterium arcticum TaxID=1784713 RepID=A0A345HD55_9FLAO|nr:PKD domain-containing protein [Flavobacterium arcticum]AXG74515.1 T9SS C-terminal target domain-containing protein [Flavobacterium arcticum]KAF2512364.1 T9SS type A sorting domain-containing protein [Flavobacterium arcticum]
MKKKYFIKLAFSLCLITTISNAQSWQWGVSGGSFDSDTANDETVKCITTDNDGNVYSLSNVGVNGLQVAGVNKEGFNGIDYMISSFSCSGEYRWSRVIGGPGTDEIQRIQTDAQGNIYAVGKIKRNGEAYFGGETGYDIILPTSSSSVNLNKQNLFIVKYSSEGELLWMEMPQPEDISYTDALINSKSLDFQVDDAGNSYWLCFIPPGTYADGAFVNTLEGNNLFIFKYDADGNFITASESEMQPIENSSMNSIPNMQLVLDHNNNNFYISCNKINTDIVDMDINGETISNNSFLAAFNEDGNFLWKIVSTIEQGSADILDMFIDSDNMLYLSGSTFDGNTLGETTFTSPTNGGFPYIIKLNAEGEVIWATNGSTINSSTSAYSITVQGNEVAVTGGFGILNWDGLELSQETNEGYDIYLARFNKQDGSIIGLTDIEGNSGYWDYGNAITADIYGSYYVGGRFDNLLYIGDTTLADGAQGRDFFIAKYGTENCDCSIPQPSFGVVPDEQNGSNFSFNYTGTTPYNTILWSFGDGQTSDVESPEYSYSTLGTYNVCVTVTNDCGDEEYCTEVEATTLGTAVFKNTLATVYPNPVDEVLNVRTEKALSYKVYSILGSEIAMGNLDAGSTILYFDSLESGVYFLHLSDKNNTSEVIKLFKK